MSIEPPPCPPPPFRAISALLREQAAARPRQPALIIGEEALSYGELDARVDRVAAALQREQVGAGASVAVCARPSLESVLAFLGGLRAGAAVAPLAPSLTPRELARMCADAGASCCFVDASAPVPGSGGELARSLVALEPGAPGRPLRSWMAPEGARPAPFEPSPQDPFNLIYSSGTTGTPKGIVQSHGMRWVHVLRSAGYDYDAQTVTLLATPLYSNTTLVAFLPTLARGGTTVWCPRFDPGEYLVQAQRYRMTHTMLVPVQYRRLLEWPGFDAYDLATTRWKFCTSAPFSAELKAQVLRRWPGGLVEFYGMTEGGGTCILDARARPDKLHTVGQPAPGHDLRLIDEQGCELAAGQVGEIVGHSPAMMSGYHRQPEKTREAEWFDAAGKRFIRTGDLGRFDDEGFLLLLDRRKDMLISGGFNVYPSDLESALRAHPSVAEAAVVGVPSVRWGETPVAYVVARADAPRDPDALLAWTNARLGKVQRLAALEFLDELPRSAIGKVLKRELRERWLRAHGPAT